MESRRIDLFHLNGIEFFETLRKGLFSKDLPVKLCDFILTVHEVTSPNSPMNEYAFELLTMADIHFSAFKSQVTLNEVNQELAIAFDKAHSFILTKLRSLDKSIGYNTPEGETKIKSSIRWRKSKAKFAHLCHMINVGGCIMDDGTFADLIRNLSAALNIDVTVEYVNKIIASVKYQSSKRSLTSFLDDLKKDVESDLLRRLEDESDCA